jgi:hypothetical protein
MVIESLESRRLLSVNILVHHGDTANDGANLSETILTPTDVNQTDFGKQFATTLDGYVFAQPLYVQNVAITRGSSVGIHSVVYVATMADSLYAIDANTGQVLWKDSFLNPVDPTHLTAATGVTSIPAAAIGGNSVGPQLGILATPAIDLSRGAIFLNAGTQEIRGSDSHYVQRLWSVSLSDGSVLTAPAVIGDTIGTQSFYSFAGYQYVAGAIVSGSGNNAHPTSYPNTDGWVSAPGGATTPVIAFNSILEMQRTAVTLLNGNVYLGFASHGDGGPYYGWILGYSESNLALTAAFVTTPTYEGIVGDSIYTAQGGIWASGSGFATDGTYLYITTGNGAFNTAASNFNSAGFPIDHDYSDSLLKLKMDGSTPAAQNGNGWGLGVADYFTPSNAAALNTLDLDLGSGGVTLLPSTLKDGAGNPMLTFGGKESRLYLLDQDNLGKFNFTYPSTGNPDPRLYDGVLGEYPGDGINGSASGLWATPAYFNGDFYVGADNQSIQAFSVLSFSSGATPPGTSVTPSAVQTGPEFGYPGLTFTVSANGASGGILWAVSASKADLLAFAATNIYMPLYDSNLSSADLLPSVTKFGVPTVANGMVYTTTQAGQLVGYGLKNAYVTSKPGYFNAPSGLVVTRAGSADARLSWTSNSSLATEFRIDRSADGLTWTTAGYVENALRTFDDPTASSYFYRVVAISGSAVSSPSNTASAGSGLTALTGSIIGTAGSFQNDGNTIAKAFDGNFATFFDAPAASGNWVGLDLGTAGGVVTQINYASRAGWASRMNGGIFQASNSPAFTSGVVNLYTIPANANPSSTRLTTQALTNTTAYRYYRYLSPSGGYGNISELQFLGTAGGLSGLTQITGTVIGTAGSYQNAGNTIAKAADGTLNTFFDAPTANGNWVGQDLGAATLVKQISYAPRAGFPGRMIGGVFQASNTADFSAGVANLYTITTAPPQGVLTNITLNLSSGYRYYRYLSPAGSYGNISEFELFD